MMSEKISVCPVCGSKQTEYLGRESESGDYIVDSYLYRCHRCRNQYALDHILRFDNLTDSFGNEVHWIQLEQCPRCGSDAVYMYDDNTEGTEFGETRTRYYKCRKCGGQHSFTEWWVDDGTEIRIIK